MAEFGPRRERTEVEHEEGLVVAGVAQAVRRVFQHQQSLADHSDAQQAEVIETGITAVRDLCDRRYATLG